MVTVEYARKGTRFALLVSGHAGAAPKDEDLVCSAVSILIYTTAQRALDLYKDGKLRSWPLVETESGKSYVAAYAKQMHGETAAQTFETVMTGFRLLEMQYPQFVTVKESSPG